MNIYVGNLSIDVTEDQLLGMFKEYGTVESVKIITDKFSGQSRGFGFVEMPSNSEADQAIKGLNGNSVKGQTIKVNPANSGRKKKKRRRRY